MKIALLQLSASEDKSANLAKAISMAQDAIEKNAEFILLPEVFNYRGDGRNKELFAKASEKIPGPSTEVFIALAKKHKTAFLLGSIIEKTANPRAHNTSIHINSDGKINAKYRKIHLFDACIGDKIVKESDSFLVGKKPVIIKEGDFTIGMSICYDLRFPVLYHKYAAKGANLLVVPSCFTKKTGEAHWETLLRARAIENLSYVLAPNQVGIDVRGMQAYGNSMIISPWGEIIARGSKDREEIVFGEINIEEVSKARSILPGIIKFKEK